MTSDIEALRGELRERAKAVPPREIAEHTGVSHGTIYALIRRDSTVKPTRGTLDKIRRWLARCPAEAGSGTGHDGAAHDGAPNAAGRVPNDGAPPYAVPPL